MQLANKSFACISIPILPFQQPLPSQILFCTEAPSRYQNCDVTTMQNSLVLFCTGLRNNSLFLLMATSSKKFKTHSQNTTFWRSKQCYKDSTSLGYLSICCNEALCPCNIHSITNTVFPQKRDGRTGDHKTKHNGIPYRTLQIEARINSTSCNRFRLHHFVTGNCEPQAACPSKSCKTEHFTFTYSSCLNYKSKNNLQTAESRTHFCHSICMHFGG